MDNKAEFDTLERISLEYISHERSFLRINIIIPILFIIGQMMQFIIIFTNRKILPQELRGFLIIVLIIILILINVYHYYNLQQYIRQYQKTPRLTQVIYYFNEYKRRFTRILYMIGLLSIVYIIVYFGGFILNQINNQTPLLKPTIGIIMDFLIYVSFLLQIIYLGIAWRHIRQWRRKEKKQSDLENKILDELDFDD